MNIIKYKGRDYPHFQAEGNASQFAIPFAKHFCKGYGIDIGCNRQEWAFPGAIGVDLNFNDGNDAYGFEYDDLDYIYSSHCLEHIDNYQASIRDWFRVVKPGGFLIIAVPHYQLYEKSFFLPSRFNDDHKRLYHPGVILMELHNSLPIGEWRLRHCQENDLGFDYTLPVEVHSAGAYEIEVVIEKIAHYPYIDQMIAHAHNR